MITKILSKRVRFFPLASIAPMMFCKQRQIALVSAKVIKMISNESENDKGTIVSKLKKISPNQFSRLSKWESIKNEQIKQICKQMKYEMSLNDFRHFMSVEENREHEEKIMAFLESQKDKQKIAQKLKLQNDGSYSALTEESINQVKLLFTTGRVLEKYFKSQQKGQQNSIQKQFIFHPTTIVTLQIFRNILSINAGNSPIQLYQKQYGTASFILFTLLMNNVTNYAVCLQPMEKLKQFKQQINLPLTKIIYWCFKEDYKENLIKQHILMQCPEVLIHSLNDKSQLLEADLEKFIRQIQLFYKSRQMNCIAIIDQIDQFASIIRQHNQKYYKSIVKLNENQRNQKKRNYRKLQELNKWRQKVANIGNQKIYINISQKFKNERMRTKGNQGFGMHFSGHQKTKQVKLPYLLYANKPKTLDEIYEFWINQNHRQDIQLTQKNKQKIRQVFSQMEFEKLISFLQKFDKQNLIQQNKKLLSARIKQKKNRKSLIKQQDFESVLSFIQLIYNKLRFVNDHDNIVINRHEIGELSSSYRNSQEKISEFLSNNRFEQQSRHNVAGFPKSQMLRLLVDIYCDSPIISKCYKSVKNNHNLKTRVTSLFGQLFQLCLTRAIKSITNHGLSAQFRCGNQCLQINNYAYFQQFNELGKQSNMQEFINKIKQNPNQYWLGIPFNSQKKEQSNRCFYIDFCIENMKELKISFSQNYEFIFFDVKTGQSFNFNEKEQNVKKLKKILKNQIPSQNIKFIVLCSKDAKVNKIIYKYSFKLQLIDYLNIKCDKQTEDLKSFNRLKEYYLKNYESDF